MKAPPKDWPRMSSALFYRDPVAMIDWLCAALDFKVRIKIASQDGSIEHSELTYGESLIMVSRERIDDQRFGVDAASPLTANAITQSLMLYVDDLEAHCERARSHGATITNPPEVHDYGEEYWADKSYALLDPENHCWFFAERLRTAGA